MTNERTVILVNTSPEMYLEHLRLRELLIDKCKSRNVYYIPNPGNWGDALIRQGTLRFLSDCQIDFKEVSDFQSVGRNLRRSPLCIYGGGGSWSKLWHGGYDRVSLFAGKFEIIVLPSTYEGSYNLQMVTWFARDRFDSLAYMPHAAFCPDMAFYLGLMKCQPGSGEGILFRTDKEAHPSRTIARDNFDLSKAGNHLAPVYPFLEHIAQYSVIRTDRLHVAIAGCLLGKEVYLHEGAYFKNKSVYLSSIDGFFDKVHFVPASSESLSI